MTGRHTLLTGVVLGALLVGTVAGPTGAARTDASPEPSLTVALASDGDARVTLVSTYDLDDGSERAAFDELRTNETVRNAYEERQAARWRTLADDTSDRMTVRNSSLTLSRSNATGVATVSVTWTNLAAAEDGILTFGEPFASSGGVDRPLVVVFPEGYQVTSISPGPANSSDGRLVYAADAELDGLSVVATSATAPNGTPAPSPTSVGTTGGSGPGFAVVGALVALLAAALIADRGG